jgi:hypothetical protein
LIVLCGLFESPIRNAAMRSAKPVHKFSVVADVTVYQPRNYLGRSEFYAPILVEGVAHKFLRQRTMRSSSVRHAALVASGQHNSDGGATRGSHCEAQCTGGVRRVCVRWRDLAGSFLSF